MGRTGDSLVMNSPHEVGDEALTERIPLSGESVPWNGGVMIVVVVVVVVVVVAAAAVAVIAIAMAIVGVMVVMLVASM